MVIALPRLQTATTKRCENASASVKLNYRSLPVGPQRGKDDRREYVRGGGLHGGTQNKFTKFEKHGGRNLEATRFKSLLSLEISIVRSLTNQRSDLGFYAAC